ncbi:esterase FE4-like [Schistocerca gregaria]|uniref:esterase FE4-like n=1 Tax=Schistocerca gregaria TaxID=7010 RepID=UPI00211EC749|nr:esterase FE4-like [Schistocerca gregaria]
MFHLKIAFLTLIFIIYSTVKHVQGAERIFKTVNTPLGRIRGRLFNTTSGNPVYIFRGIPYAEPPVGQLRFKPPVPLSPWNDTKDALSYPERCIQRTGDGTIEGVEDCLYLNVFTPELPSNISVPRPVLVMIHGGCFMTGYAEERPLDFYIDHGIVVITLQYRLGALGFMSTGDSLLPGNLGMKDQVLALQWVKQNILAFGGNPDEVTIEGQSSGGAAVQYHMMSPKSKGLFKRAIAQSGSALCPWSFSKNATDRTYRYTSYLGHDAQNSSDLMEFLMTVDAAALVEARYPALNQEDRLSTLICVWAPHVEPEHEDAFLTEEPWVIMSENRYTHVPYLTGVTDYELLIRTQENEMFGTEEGIQDLNDNFDGYVAHELRFPTREEQLNVSAQIRQFYYGDSEITLELNDTTATMISDLMIVEAVDTTVRNMSRDSSEPVYYYQFSFSGPLNAYPNFPGASHGDDRRYMSYYTSLETDSAGYRIAMQLLQLWTNFVKYSDPIPYDTDELLTEDWKQYEADSTNYLGIGSTLEAGTGLNKERMDFWHSVMP